MTTRTLLVPALASALLATGACKKNEQAAPPPKPDPTKPTTTGSGSATGSGTGSGSAPGSAATGSGSAATSGGTITVTEGLATPESVLHDPASDLYLVSNINGKPLEADDNGYIARVSPDGKLVDARWIDGDKNDVTLNAPKGMALISTTLWVADIDTVRMFDATTGAPAGDVKIDGAAFLNDVMADGAGGIFVSDTGVDASFKTTGADAIYRVGADKQVSPFIKATDLGGPNGLAAGANGDVWVATFGSGDVYAVTANGKNVPGTKPPKGQLDGLVALPGGDVLVSSWEGQAIFRGTAAGVWTTVAEGLEAPADFAVDAKRNVLVIPHFLKSTLTILPLK